MNTNALKYFKDISLPFRAFSTEFMAVLFDSGKPEQTQGRYDIFSARPNKLICSKNGHFFVQNTDGNDQKSLSFEQVKALLNENWNTEKSELPFCGGWIGFASYELGYELKPKSGKSKEERCLPEFLAAYYPWAVVQDHQEEKAYLAHDGSLAHQDIEQILKQLEQTPEEESFSLNNPFSAISDMAPAYQEQFSKIQQYLLDGDCYQVNLSLKVESAFTGPPYKAYETLRKSVPSPHMVYMNLEHGAILSISPERFLAADKQHIESKPIKGTAPRSSDEAQDQQSHKALANSAKNRAENLMIVDLLRNDLGQHCTPGSIIVKDLFNIESFSNVHHMVSTIQGEIEENSTIWDVFFDAFPGGSITGAPKLRAQQIINELEEHNREIYCGSIFYASNSGRFDSSISIRTLLCHYEKIFAWAGGGIVKDSEVNDELNECKNKIETLLKALESI